MRRSQGFSLVELMIALAIFALLVTMAYQAVNLLLDAGRRIETPQRELQQLQRAMALIERDFHQLALLRPANRGNPFSVGQAASNSIQQPDVTGVLLEFTRGGNPDVAWQARDSALRRSTLQRVRYVWEDGRLLRQTWNLVDHIETAEPVSQVLLEGLSAAPQFRFRQERGGSFVAELPREPQKLVAIALHLEHRRFGKLQRIFMVYL
ncbi:MAG: type II secretion system minor pseudopilin GspJ [Thiothrix sp.]